MGAIIENCTSKNKLCCSKKRREDEFIDNSSYLNNPISPFQSKHPSNNINENINNFSAIKEESSLDDSYLNTSNQIDEDFENNNNFKNYNDIKLKTSNLIMKRDDNPYNVYTEICTLGSGTFGTVKKVKLKNNNNVIRAMKIIPKENVLEGVDSKTVISEISILKKLDHPNIMKIYEFYEDEKNYYIISEFCDQGDLLGKMNKLHSMTELVVRFLMRQVLDAVAYLHNRKVLHGDIKMENLLLYTAVKKAQKRFTVLSLDTKDESLQKEINLSFQKRSLTFNTKKFMRNITSYEIKLIDFGCSKIFSKKHHKNLSGIIGTSAYCSPEVIDDIYDERCDEWSCGVLMYLLLCGEIPFPGDTEEEMFSKIKKGKFSFHQKEFKNVSNNAKDLICNLLMYNKDYRITASQALQHPFFTESFDPKLLSYNKDLTKLTELIEIKKFGKFQESIIAYLTINFIDKDEENQLKEVFRYIDKNNKNFLKKDDIEYCFKANGYFLDKESIDHIFSVLDYDMNGVVEYQEFFRALVDKKKLFSDENLKVAFELLDENKKNEISWNDIKRVFFHEQKMNDNLIDEYLKEIGMTKEKTLNFQEFCKVMRKCL